MSSGRAYAAGEYSYARCRRTPARLHTERCKDKARAWFAAQTAAGIGVDLSRQAHYSMWTARNRVSMRRYWKNHAS